MTKQNDILQEALKIINADRRVEYGDAKDSFTALAKVWTWYLHTKYGDMLISEIELDGTDVAMFMSLMKISRHTTGKPKKDNLVDLAGYAALAGQFIPENEAVLMAAQETEGSDIPPCEFRGGHLERRNDCSWLENKPSPGNINPETLDFTS